MTFEGTERSISTAVQLPDPPGCRPYSWVSRKL